MFRLVVIDDQEQFAEVVRATMGTEPDLVAVNVHIGPGDGVAAMAQINRCGGASD